MTIAFKCIKGSLAGKTLQFQEPLITFGRRPSSMVQFTTAAEPRVSGAHCEVVLQDGAYFIHDKNSSNGTFVNGVQVKAPTRLHNGSLIRLGDVGPELVVGFPEDDQMDLTLVGPSLAVQQAQSQAREGTPAQEAVTAPTPVPGSLPAAAPFPPPMSEAMKIAVPGPAASKETAAQSDSASYGKDGIGMMTLMTKLDQAKLEVRSEYSHRMRWVYVVGGALLVLAVALIVWVKVSSDRQIQDIQNQLLAQLDQSKRDAESRYNEIKENTDASAQTKLEQLQKLLDEKTAFVQSLAVNADKAGMDSKAVRDEMIRNREALKAIQTQIGDLNAFVSFKERYSKCVYSLVLRFTEGGVAKYSFVGSAFGLSRKPALLGTTARVVEAIKPLLEDSQCQLVARCNGDAQYTYLVQKTYVHPDFKVSDAGVGKDVALLRLDLRVLRADGTLGAELAMPETLLPAPEDELEQVVSGVNVAVFGFSDLDRARLEGNSAATGVATLSTNIVDGTLSFAGVPVAGRAFGLLRHNCTVMKGFAGAPVVNTKNHVIGVQSNTITLAAARGGLQIPAPNSACAVSIKTLLDLQTQILQKESVSK